MRLVTPREWIARMDAQAERNARKGESMDKQGVMKRLDAIERKAAELRKIIEKPDGIKFTPGKMYIGIRRGNRQPYILDRRYIGTDMLYAFKGYHDGEALGLFWDDGKSDPQEYLDESAGAFDIHAFDDVRKGLEFFLKHYRG
jgi:hypothetical protein